MESTQVMTTLPDDSCVTKSSGSVSDNHAPAAPPGRTTRAITDHGFRSARLSAGSAPPVATFHRPSGAGDN
jgi:hypothetical protein